MYDDQYTRDLEVALWMANHNQPEYELTITNEAETKKYKIQKLREMQEILEQYKSKNIGVTLRRVKKKNLPNQ